MIPKNKIKVLKKERVLPKGLALLNRGMQAMRMETEINSSIQLDEILRL